MQNPLCLVEVSKKKEVSPGKWEGFIVSSRVVSLALTGIHGQLVLFLFSFTMCVCVCVYRHLHSCPHKYKALSWTHPMWGSVHAQPPLLLEPDAHSTTLVWRQTQENLLERGWERLEISVLSLVQVLRSGQKELSADADWRREQWRWVGYLWGSENNRERKPGLFHNSWLPTHSDSKLLKRRLALK